MIGRTYILLEIEQQMTITKGEDNPEASHLAAPEIARHVESNAKNDDCDGFHFIASEVIRIESRLRC